MPHFGVKVKKSIYFGLNFPNDTELPDSLLLLPSYFVPWHDLQFKNNPYFSHTRLRAAPQLILCTNKIL